MATLFKSIWTIALTGRLQPANGLIGRNVTLQAAHELIPSDTVTSLQLLAGTPKTVANASLFDASQMLAISSLQTTYYLST